jgi:predicted DsbA family dithiol-disulfide isomerase
LKKDYDIVVDLQAFLLRPDTPKEGAPRQPRPGEEDGQLSEPLRTYAQEAGLTMRRSAIIPNTMYSLEATEYAQQQGAYEEFHHALYRAYWEHQKNLGDLAVIEEVAVECGLNWPELSHRLETGYYREAVLTQYQDAMEIGIRGIPAFLIGNQLFTGAQPYDVFKLAMSRAQQTYRPQS